MHNEIYNKQVELLLDVLPFISDEPSFALKGGTAINLFHRDMPRLSVDIDLTYLPIETRDFFLVNLNETLQRLAEKIRASGLEVDVKYQGENLSKLFVSNKRVIIKIEPNTVLRGCLVELEMRELVPAAQENFLQIQKMKVVSRADLYAGKICAALDRQHPRDLFDVKLLFDNEGFTDDIRQAFVAYLASSPRPMSELLAPNELHIEDIYRKEFVGMTREHVDLDELYEARSKLIRTINSSLQPNEKQFLLSLKAGSPEWERLTLDHVSELPGIRWKLMNIRKMCEGARLAALEKLKRSLGN
jgi:predicted nucleotidyltransferase component of viral defense system